MSAHDFNIVVGTDCNFRCKYCYEKAGEEGYSGIAMNEETIQKTVEYLHYIHNNEKEKSIRIDFIGGETLLYFGIVKKLIIACKDVAGTYVLITNGSLVEQYKTDILNMRSILRECGTYMTFSVSYDYALQNEYRAQGSYETVRNAIRWLRANDLVNYTVSVLTRETLPRIHEVFFDFIALREELPGLKTVFNVDFTRDLSGFDEEGTKASLAQIRDYLKEHPEHYGAFTPNSGIRHNNKKSCYAPAINPDNSVMCGCSALYLPKAVKQQCTFGSILDEPGALTAVLDEEEKRALAVPEECKACEACCRVRVYTPLINGDGTYNGMPSAEICAINKLVHEYLGEFYNK